MIGVVSMLMQTSVVYCFPQQSISWDKIATAVIATCVAIVGLMQWLTARDKLRLDLYNRRFDIYSKVLEFVSRVNDVDSDKVAQREIMIRDCVRGSREAQFLFDSDPEIARLIERIRLNAIIQSDFYLLVTPYAPAFGSRLKDEIRKRQAAETEIAKDLPELERLLQPFLTFGNLKSRRLQLMPFASKAIEVPPDTGN